jgi:glycosyltransferase involved in cell wall biosynthesis
MRKPRLSVVINNYNYADYVGEAIESVLAQDCADVECVVVDDGSTDSSRAVIERYAGIKRVYKANGGQLSAVQAGFAEASGDIIVFLDSDDFLHPNACREIAAGWRSGLSLLQFGLTKIDNAGNTIGAWPSEPFIAADHLGFLLEYGYIPASPMSGNAFSRQYLAELFAVSPPDERMAADGYLIYCAPLFGGVGAIERTLGCYRVHGRNTSPSASVNAGSLQRQLLNDIKFREGLARHMKRRGFSPDLPLNYLGPYDFRTILLLNRGYREISRVANIDSRFAAMQAVKKFFTYPGIPLWNRVKNIAGVVAIAALPPGAVRRLLPGDATGAVAPGAPAHIRSGQ